MGTTVPTAPTRPRTLVVASAFGTGSVIMYFGGLFALYFSIRADALAWGTQWYPEGAIQLVPGGMNTVSYTHLTLPTIYSV